MMLDTLDSQRKKAKGRRVLTHPSVSIGPNDSETGSGQAPYLSEKKRLSRTCCQDITPLCEIFGVRIELNLVSDAGSILSCEVMAN